MPQRLRTPIDNDNIDNIQVVDKDGAAIVTPIGTKLALEELFNHGRWKRPFTFRHLAFILYLPVGIVIWPFRFLILIVSFTLGLLLPKSITVKIKTIIKFVMGIRIKISGLENLPKKGDKDAARIVVCNHLSDFDPYPLFEIFERYHVMVAAHIRNVPIVGSLYEKFDTIYIDQTNKAKARTDVLNSLSKSDIPLLIYPEGGLNNGKKGLMMFNKFVFGLGHKVLPIAMKINNPWPVEIDYIGSSWFKNFFMWILIPYHNFELDFLPAVSINEGEIDADFAKRVQTLIADHLGIEATNYTYTQKKELAKKLLDAKKNK